jgi:ketosteroid isomerase-like protein
VSRENVEIFRRSMLLSNPNVPEAEWKVGYDEFFYADAEWVIAKEHPAARTLVGFEQLADYLREWQATLSGVGFEHERVLDAGERVLAIGRVRGTGIASGAQVAVPLALLCTFQDGLIVRVEEYLNTAEALKAVGLEG